MDFGTRKTLDKNNIQGYRTFFHPKTIGIIIHDEQHSIIFVGKVFTHHTFGSSFVVMSDFYIEDIVSYFYFHNLFINMKKRRDVASVLVKVGDECLLCKRAPSQSYPNTWSIPGGGVDKGEEPKEAAAREFYEETDNEISVDDLVFRAVMPKVKNGKTKGLMYIYTLQPNEKIYPDLENAEDGHEHSECRYFQVDKLDKMEMGTNLYKVVRKIFGLD
jgi:8-oxo-dGTP pyrophosphatase MutT (NUDIX family)